MSSTFSTLKLEYDCINCGAIMTVNIKMPDFGEAVPTYFECKGCGQKNVMTVGLEPDERKEKGVQKCRDR